jgi:hypothetical protein
VSIGGEGEIGAAVAVEEVEFEVESENEDEEDSGLGFRTRLDAAVAAGGAEDLALVASEPAAEAKVSTAPPSVATAFDSRLLVGKCMRRWRGSDEEGRCWDAESLSCYKIFRSRNSGVNNR